MPGHRESPPTRQRTLASLSLVAHGRGAGTGLHVRELAVLRTEPSPRIDRQGPVETADRSPTMLPYRPEIDGLRAIAVLSVVVFHAKLGVAPGGFAGVDVFFVISGFLISSIIKSEIDAGQFSLARFYERRIRRIIPALLTVIGACLVAGYVLMTPQDYDLLGRSALAAVGFHSNFWFAERAGYFMPDAETMPLLHTWSLGVEEQFYVVAPLLLMWGLKAKVWKAKLAFWLMVISGLVLSQFEVQRSPDFAFYGTHARAFELLIGVGLGIGLAPAITNMHLRLIAVAAGIGMIAYSMTGLNADTPFPGLAALFPCLGAAFVIHGCSGTDTKFIGTRLLAIPPLVFTGKISYSLYLWHWPVLAFAQYGAQGELEAIDRLGLIALSFAAAVASYFVIEQPARRGRLSAGRAGVFGAALAGSALVASGALVIRANDGLHQRFTPDVASFAEQIAVLGTSNYGRICGKSALDKAVTCKFGSHSVPPSVLVWGDSHAAAVFDELDSAAHARGVSGLILARGGCPPILAASSRRNVVKRKCESLAPALDAALKDPSIDTVILISRWHHHLARETVDDQGGSLRSTVETIRATGKKVVIVGPVPEVGFNLPSEMIKARMRGNDYAAAIAQQDFIAQNAEALDILAKLDDVAGVSVLYPHEALCDGQICPIVREGLPIYRDDNHVNRVGAGLLRPLIETALR